MKTKFNLFLMSLLAVFFLFTGKAYAATPTDEITDYTITVDVNSDATLNINYHIDWLVLESDGIGPVSWVEVGIPNKHCESYIALSDNIKQIDSSFSGANSTLKIYFNDDYYEGETISFDFSIIQNNMYRVNKLAEGYTVYSFTPGWFDEIDVDSLTIRWNGEKVDSWSPDCSVDGDYIVFNTALDAGDKFTVDITYPNDAYGFDLSMQEEESGSGSVIENIFVTIFAIIFFIVIIVVCFGGPILFFGVIFYLISGGFGKQYTKKITRTKIEYYPECEGCGAPRQEGEKFCTFCGRSMVKSEETVEEKNVPEEIKKKTTNGEYRYSSSPNTYYRVNVVRVPVARTRSYTSSSGRSSSSHHSSCAHSSCACACACACAGGGRAGCTNKDFYNTKLKMRHIKKAVKSIKE